MSTEEFQVSVILLLRELVTLAKADIPKRKPEPIHVRKRKRIAAAAIAIAEGANSARAVAASIGVDHKTVLSCPEIVKMLDSAGGLARRVDQDAAEEFVYDQLR